MPEVFLILARFLTKRGFSTRHLGPLTVFTLGLVVTGFLAHWVYHFNLESAHRDFAYKCNELQLKISERLVAYEQILKGAAGLFAACTNINRQMWHEYVGALQLEKQYPGILGVGFTQLIPADQLDQHLREVRAEGFPFYNVWPEGPREIYTSIVLLEPFTNRNVRAFGYDMFSDPIRQAAMKRAYERNELALTSKVRLVQETSVDVQAGTLMFMPLYTPGRPLHTAEHRQIALRGWVYSPYRMNDLMRGIIQDDLTVASPQTRLRVFDGKTSLSPDYLLFDSRPGTDDPRPQNNFLLPEVLDIAGQHWTLSFSHPISVGITISTWITALAGTAGSALLASLLHAWLTTRINARRIAAQLTSELQHTSDRLMLATESGGVGVWELELSTYTLSWDHQTLQLYGQTPETFAGTYAAWCQAVHPGDRQKLADAIEQAVQGSRELSFELRVPLAHPEPMRFLQVCARVYGSSNGQAGRISGACWDITNAKQAAEALREREQNFRNFFESTGDSILVTTLEGRVVFANSIAVTTLGCSSCELVGKEIAEFYPPEHLLEARDRFTAMLHGNSSSCRLPLICRRNGALIPAETRFSKGRWNDQDCIFVIIKDISSEAEAHQRFEHLFRSNPSMLAIIDLPGGKFFDVNHAFLLGLGYSRSNLIGKTSAELDLVPESEHQQVLLLAIHDEKLVNNFEIRLKRNDGALLEAMLSCQIIRSRGHQFLLIVLVDITARKHAEQELRRALAAERELSNLKSKFVSMVSHEFRTPLSSILSSAEILEGYYDRLPPAKRSFYFETIRQQVQRLTGMLQNLLLQGQIETGFLKPHPRMTNVAKACQEILVRMQTNFPKHSPIAFDNQLPSVYLLTDPNLLESILTNLLSNALKYSPAFTPVFLRLRKQPDFWIIEVEDQGIGISSDDIPQVFSAFQRGANVGTIKGSGVGLFIVKECVELQGGRLELSSQEGVGSKFTAYLPWLTVDFSEHDHNQELLLGGLEHENLTS